jgi:hypothetical protein
MLLYAVVDPKAFNPLLLENREYVAQVNNFSKGCTEKYSAA